MSIWRGRGSHVDPPLDWQDPADYDEAEWIARLSEIAGLSEPAPQTVARRPVEGKPPWPVKDVLPMADDVAAGHSANWETRPDPDSTFLDDITGGQRAAFRAPADVPDPAGVPSSVSPPTGSGTHPGHVAAIRDAIDPQPVPFTATVEPSAVLARAAEVLPPTFTQELLSAPLEQLPDMFGEVPGE